VGSSSARILVVDDDAGVREALDMFLRYEGFEVTAAASGAAALDELERQPPDLVFLDVKMPGVDGMELLGRLRARWPAMPVIMISGHGDIRTAVEALKRGAEDFLEKPLDANRTTVVARNAIRRRALEAENRALREALDRDIQWIAESTAARELADLADRVARSDERVLICGDSGTGKELLARRIHAASARRGGPFEVLHCGAIAPTLLEDELFGHATGAYTGAARERAGVFGRAVGGTLLLDEVGELPLEAQAKILRVIETGEWTPLGGSPRRGDARIVATTQRDLRADSVAGRFREDLYFRLGVVVLTIPPLRERPEDILPLARQFLLDSALRARKPQKRFDAEAEELLRARPWRGNARELRNAVEALDLLVENDTIGAGDVRAYFSDSERAAPEDFMDAKTLDEFRIGVERMYLARQIAKRQGNMKRTALELGMSRANLYRMLERLGMRTPGAAAPPGDDQP
jgi:two-component system nitrogen regulation response regulator NtrX